MQFLTVWGTGEKGAETWWSQGCRTLEDLRSRTDLSVQQVCTCLMAALTTRCRFPHLICLLQQRDPDFFCRRQVRGTEKPAADRGSQARSINAFGSCGEGGLCWLRHVKSACTRITDALLLRVIGMTMQAAGLKYYEDMQQRIPRKEVAAIEGMVKEAVLDVLGCRGAHDASTLFCNAVGR